MNGYRRYLLNYACYAAEDGAGAPAADTPAPDAAPAGDAPVADGAPADPAPPADSEPPKEPAWFRSRIDALARQNGEAVRARQNAERERDELRAKLPSADGPPDPNARTYTQADFDREVTVRAQQVAEKQVAESAVKAVISTGERDFTPAAFTAACNALADVGATERPEFLTMTADLPNGAAVLHKLGNEPGEAMRVLALPPLRMAAELGRISAILSAPAAAPAPPAPKQVSKAPAPIEPVTTRGSPVAETDPERMTPEQYASWRDKQRADRRGK